MVELRLLGVSAEDAERLREWKKEPIADRWVFEQVRDALDKALLSLPRSVKEQAFWQSAEGQFFAELLYDTCPPDYRLDTTGAITKAYGEPADYEAWWKLYMRLNRAMKSGRVHSHRLPERELKRKKNSSKEQGRWYYAPEIDTLKKK